jgi:hypothetical protein
MDGFELGARPRQVASLTVELDGEGWIFPFGVELLGKENKEGS